MAVSWDEAVTDWAGFAPLPGDTTADACVVGLGASGLAAVQALADRGLTVVGVDAGRVAAGASGRNAGFLLGGPALALHQAIARWGEAAVDLYRGTLGELDRLTDLLGPQVIRRTGSLRLAGLPGATEGDGAEDEGAEGADGEAAEMADCAAHAAALRRHGIAVESYDGPLGRGLYLPDDAAANPAVRAVRTAGLLAGRATLHEHTHVHHVARGRVETDRGTIRTDVVIVAVDGGLDVLLPALACRVRTARLQMLATQPVAPGRLPCPVYARWGYDYAQQLPGGRLVAGGGRDRFLDAEWTTAAEPTEQVQAYVRTLAERMAGGPVDVTNRWAAPVGFTGDGRPLCSLVEDRVVAVGGYNGTGNLIGPLAARAGVALAVDGTPPPAWCST